MNESEINKLINSMTKKFKNGGFIDCLRAGSSLKTCGCGAKVEKGAMGMNVNEPEKKRRVDTAGYAYRKNDGTAVLTRDAQGVRIPAGSSYVYEDSIPPMSTEMRVETNKGGQPIRYEFDVFNDGGDNNFGPIHRYSSDPKWYQFRRVKLTPEALEEYLNRYRKNGLLKNGGEISRNNFENLPKKKSVRKLK